MHRQPCLQLVCAFDFRGPGKLNSSSHDGARISHARRRVEEAPGAPSRARTAVTAARCVGGSRCSACVAVARFLFLLSFFSHSRPPPSSDPGVGGRCAMSRAAVSRERVISVPGWPTCRHHKAPTGKASQCHPTAGEAAHGVVQARIVRCVGRPIKVFQGTKFDINSKCLCVSISPATAKLVSPPYQAGCWRALPVDEEAPGTCMGARNVCAYPRCILHMITRVAGRFIPGKPPNLRASRASTASLSRIATECLGE